MAFRDDRDALRAKSEALEGDISKLRGALEDAEAELASHEAKDVSDESEVEQLREEVGHLRRRLGIETPAAKGARKGRTGIVVIGVILAIGAAVYLYVTPGEEPPPVPDAVALVTDHASFDIEDDITAGMRADVERSGLPPDPSQTALFGAVVVATEAADLEVGEGCVLEVELAEDPRRVALWCNTALGEWHPTEPVLFRKSTTTAPLVLAARLDTATVSIGTLRHEIKYEAPSGGSVLMWVESFAPVHDVMVPPERLPAAGPELVVPDLDALYRAVVDDASCDLAAEFSGRARTHSAEHDDVTLRAGETVRTTSVGGEVVDTARESSMVFTGPFGRGFFIEVRRHRADVGDLLAVARGRHHPTVVPCAESAEWENIPV